MEIEVVGPRCGCLKLGDRIAPVVAVGLPDRKVMAARERGEIGRTDHCTPRNHREIARKLRPERRLEPQLLAHRHDPKVAQGGLHFGRAGIHFALTRPANSDGKVVFAISRAAGGNFVLGLRKFAAQR